MKITVELNEQGQILVNGDCLLDKIAACGMLQLAQHTILTQKLKAAPPAIEIADPNDPRLKPFPAPAG